ncbi:MAG: WG repeat-containing protein [Saprospiraceae bacterium]|nr:WG repeat-containing protein [Saprospiraceae bacterium]
MWKNKFYCSEIHNLISFDLDIRKQIRFTIMVIYSFSIVLFVKCKPDSGGAHLLPPDANEEELYFADYQSPVNKWGYLDPIGNIVIGFTYDEVRDFTDGLASVNYKGKWGFIDKTGKVIIDFKYMYTEDFGDGKAFVKDFSGAYFFINKNGQKIIDCRYDYCGPFSNGYSKVESEGFYGYMDSTGRLRTEIVYMTASDFKDGYAIVNKTGQPELIDLTFNPVISLECDQIFFPVDGMIRYRKNNKFSYHDLSRKKELPGMYDDATDFKDDKAVVKVENTFYIIDRNSFKQELEIDAIYYGGDCCYIYKQGGKFGYLSNEGVKITEPEYDLVYAFSEGMAAVSKNGFWGYINETGSQKAPIVLPIAWDYRNGAARFINRPGTGFLDKNGEIMLQTKYFEVRDFYEGLARVQESE